ncbi:Quinoprotein ethanol dehydrogenase precursor [Gemmata obscuriglobus]|uniref:Pyrrolo-quinoline quinone n=1 Tax=Gemmata obscuriglobus TaxID=114 RepID=A0A2Z3GSN9_9BACT|nr:PQQ-binding-like beta-propeller repeat protein [Gemmata obscuriglobus]AWM37409.1 pyrrolo-quinoline quinone [Gemmata obscuriglobus]QEG29832.1 Quinoprotein ethanol dehydrogenase precursor [Gemmata obscuriglobus]VTS09149.1 Pyrrolo-quinoline quinone repeat-containing protein OS=Planctomyces brasiliensis (strain ATCC 49424 / DSM 5305 / JCM 21570 / NBRC 103401 / IFAM 1448) GN=Plabr_0119 PE=4 SV=1: PQQ_3: PQQ_2 [Gemmata obscuriglobus UQM 2246]
MKLRTLFVVLTVAVGTSPFVTADDWPQWMGPKRDNVWREIGVLEKFPAGGPKVVWRAPVAAGYSGPAIADGKVYVTDRVLAKGAANPEDPFDTKNKVASSERVLCLDQKTGKELWKYEYPCAYQISYPAGPRCTPLVSDGKLYTLGAMGDLYCFEVGSGKVVWNLDFKEAYKAKPAIWGYAAHPIIDGKKLITLVGGEGAHVVAFDKDTGKELWKAGDDKEIGYAPPLFTEAGGVRQMIVAAPKSVYAVDPDTGKRLWTTPYNADNTSIIMTPVRSGDYLFVGGYRTKNLMLKLTADKPGVEVVFKDKKGAGLSPVNVQPFVQDGVIYGHDEGGALMAVAVPSGKRLWDSPGPLSGDPRGSDTSFIVKNGDRFFFFAESGELVIGKLTEKGYEEVDRAKVIEQTGAAFGRKVVWCAPAFADKKMYVRNDKELVCLDLAK